MGSLRMIRTVAVKEFRELFRDPITLIIALFLPVILLFIFGYAINMDIREMGVAVLDRDRTPESRDYAERIGRTEEFRLSNTIGDSDSARDLLDRGTVRVVLVIPSGFSRDLQSGKTAVVQTLVDGSFSAHAQVIRGYMEALNADFVRDHVGQGAAVPGRREPNLSIRTRVLYNPSLLSVTSIVPGLMGVILMAFPPLLTTLAVVREKERGSIRQVYVSPLQPWEFIMGKMIPYAILAFVDMVLILAAGILWFGIPLAGSPLFLTGASLLYVFATVSIGLAVSAVTRSQVVALLLILVLTVMPSFLFSGFLFPIFIMPGILQAYTYLFPGRYFVEVSRGIFLKGVGFEVLYPNVAILVLYTGVMVAVASSRLRPKLD
jgi:ABC-2 type transport system permease protein